MIDMRMRCILGWRKLVVVRCRKVKTRFRRAEVDIYGVVGTKAKNRVHKKQAPMVIGRKEVKRC